MPPNVELLKGNLIIGNIIQLNNILKNNKVLLDTIRNGFNGNGVDLVSGGPPCQSFSMAGLREKDSDKNTLPWEFASFVEHVQPKIAVLENVTGILRAFKDKNDNLFHAHLKLRKFLLLRNIFLYAYMLMLDLPEFLKIDLALL